jgi:D-alanyl-D-alanine endopeptidase (penicillin-binding protein 7)
MQKFLFVLLFCLCSKAFADTSVMVYDITDNKHQYNSNINKTRPIASITKLMTVMVSLNNDQNLLKEVKLVNKVKSNLPMQTYKRYDLIKAVLVKSDNGAAETIAEDYPGGRKAFIKAMNTTAKNIGMLTARFDDPTGLSSRNTSTANDVATMISYAANYLIIREISILKQIAIETKFKKKVRTITLNNTNKPILFEFDTIVVSKTGFTNSAGWCNALIVEKNNKRYAVVVLGAPNKQERTKTIEDVMYNHINDNEI